MTRIKPVVGKVLLRSAAAAAWSASAGFSWFIAAIRSFTGRGELALGDQLFVHAPFFTAVAFGVGYVGKLRSPWMEGILFTAPALQLALIFLG